MLPPYICCFHSIMNRIQSKLYNLVQCSAVHRVAECWAPRHPVPRLLRFSAVHCSAVQCCAVHQAFHYKLQCQSQQCGASHPSFSFKCIKETLNLSTNADSRTHFFSFFSENIPIALENINRFYFKKLKHK